MHLINTSGYNLQSFSIPIVIRRIAPDTLVAATIIITMLPSSPCVCVCVCVCVCGGGGGGGGGGE